MGWRRAAVWAGGLTTTTRNGHTKRWSYATPAEVYLDPGAHGAQPATLEAMRPEGHGRHEKT